MLNYINIGKTLFDFEEQCSHRYSHLKIFNREIWPIVKVSVNYTLIFTTINKSKSNSSSTENIKFIKRVPALLLHSIVFIIKVIWYSVVKTKRNLILFLPMSCDKLMKNKEGLFVNVLMDQMIKADQMINYLYMEFPINYDYREPSVLKRHLDATGLNIPQKILCLCISLLQINKNRARQLSSALTEFIQAQNATNIIPPALVKRILDEYYAEYLLYTVLVWLLRPKFAIVADQGATGKIGAFLNHGVHVTEVQHGMMDEYYPHYVHAANARDRREYFVVPDHILVFGAFHKELLLKHGFWKTNEITCIGNYRIDYWRDQPRKGHETFSLLFPTQWHVFNESMGFISALLSQSKEVHLDVKFHPNETETNKDEYRDLVNQYPGQISIWEPETDIYELMSSVDLVVGFDSTVLLEALALQKIVYTVASSVAPSGIHSYLNSEVLIEAIPVVKDISEFMTVLNMLKSDSSYLFRQAKVSENMGEYLYTKNYSNNCKELLLNYKKDA